MKASAYEFLSVGEVQPQRDWHMPSHSHRIHELIVVLSGRMTLKTPGGTVRGEAGDLLFYRAGVAHEETSDPADPVNTVFIAFKADAPLVANVALRTRDADARVRQMAGWLLRDQRSGIAADRHHPLLAAVLGEVRRLGHSPRDPWLEEVRLYLEQNLARAIYLDDLARRVRMSKFAFLRKFKRLGGRTPMQELQLMRVNRARAMMLASGLPVKAIAPAVGLNDEYQCRNCFGAISTSRRANCARAPRATATKPVTSDARLRASSHDTQPNSAWDHAGLTPFQLCPVRLIPGARKPADDLPRACPPSHCASADRPDPGRLRRHPGRD